ncbi:MAG: aminotransferase class IV [Desulfomonilia bacterium]|nr:aminotransferase class IV [Desulfomonilia bacterium]
METPIVAWIDGTFADSEQATVPILSHSFSRASAIFEVLSIIDADSGPAMLCLEEHVDRFFSSAQRTYLTIPFSRETIRDALIQTARKNSIRNGLAKFYAYYTDLELGNHAPHQVSVAIFCLDYTAIGVNQRDFWKPVSVGISQYRKLHPQTAAVHAKVVGNYVNGYLARTEVRRKGFEEALMLDTNGFIAEGPTSNIFLVKGSHVETPTEENVLPGITRMLIMEVLADMGYPVKEAHILPQDLCQYDEAFFSGTLKAVQPITVIEGCEFTCPGEVTAALKKKIQELATGTIPRYQRFLTYLA